MTEAVPVMSNIEDKYYTISEVADLFKVTEQTVRLWVNSKDSKKKLAAVKVGKNWRISKGALVDYVNRTYFT